MSTASDRPWYASYATDVPREIPDEPRSLSMLIDEVCRRYPKNVALEFFGATTDYASLADSIARAAEGLRRLGVHRGDRVALILPNCPQHVVAFYAVLRLGAIVVEHNPLYTPRELRHQFEDHGARFAIAWDAVVARVQDLPEDIAVDTIVSVDLTRAMPWSKRVALRLPVPAAREARRKLTARVRGTVTWERLVDHRRIRASVPGPEAADPALIQYTSGTTGTPKGAVLSHANLTANAAQSRAWVPSIPAGTSVVYAVLPLFHAYGLTLCLTFAMSIGARLVLFPAFDPDLVLAVSAKRPATFLPAVPPICARLAEAASARRRNPLAGTQIAISGAMPLPSSVVEPWEQMTGGMLVEGYGLSECSPVLMANPVGEGRRPGTVGLPMPSTEVRIVDPDSPDDERPTGEVGELVVRGPQVFRTYWRRPDETAAAFTSDGWFRTGDIASIDADGFVTIADRIKDIIITGGFNVMPAEVEECLRGHDGVTDAAVVGLPDEHSGEQIAAAVTVTDGVVLDEDAVRGWLRERIAAYKVPRRIVVVDDLPRSLVGKVVRRQVRDLLTTGADA